MPFPFVPSTTSHLTFQTNFTSTTHPSLPSSTTSLRNVVRSTLKSHKRLSVSEQANNLLNIVSCLNDYLKYLLSIDAALSGKSVAGEDVDIALATEVEVEWRPTLSSVNIPGRDSERVKGRGLDYEIYFIHQTFAVFQNLLARQALLGLYASTNPTPEQRTSLIQSATRYLKVAASVNTYLVQRANSGDGPPTFPPTAVDVSPGVQAALQRLSQAEFNLLCVLKEDPYPAIVVQSRNKDDKEWMIKAPEIPKVRAQVLTRLCIGAAEHAAVASANLQSEGKRVSKDLLEYVDDVKRTSRARACRFQALDNDLAGQTGVAIAWLNAGLSELGTELGRDGTSKSGGLSKLKSSWQERREDRRINKASSRWGADGGKVEEGRILEFLERKFTKANNTIAIQVVPEWRPLLATLPSGMNMPIDEKWRPTLLSEAELTVMRAPPEHHDDPNGDSSGEDGDDDDHGHEERVGRDGNRRGRDESAPGAFPGPGDDYSKSTYY